MNRAIYEDSARDRRTRPARAGGAAGNWRSDQQADPPALTGRENEVRAGGGAVAPAARTFLDEPTIGLDVSMQAKMRELSAIQPAFGAAVC